MAESIKNKFFSGVAWSFVQNIAVKGLSFVITIFLTRLLTPGDFGLIGMLSIFIAISEVFILSGFGDAIIQKKECSESDYSTAFYFNLGIAVLIYILLFFTAPLIADFYREPRLVILLRVLALNFVFGSMNIVQQSKLTRAMEFKPLAILSLICTFVGGLLGVVMAYLGYGVWALVAQTLGSTIPRVILFPLFTRWHPRKPFNWESFKYLWHYGSRLLVTGLIGVGIRNISNILIGRFYYKEQVGYFSRAQNLANVPSETMFSVLSSVTFPALCEVKDNPERLLGIYKKVLFNVVLIVTPIIILLALLARPIIIILFTDKWESCIPLFQALLLARLFLPIGATHTSLLRSIGNTSLYMKLYFITGPLSIVAICVSIPLGVEAMAWATFISEVFSYFVIAIVIGRKFGYSIIMQLWDWRLIFVSIVLMSVGVYFITCWIDNLWVEIIIGSLVGFGTYAICCWLFKLVDKDLIDVIKTKFMLK